MKASVDVMPNGRLPDPADSPVITPEYVAERLCEAAETLRALPMPRGGYPATAGASWPDPKIDYWEMWNQLTTEEAQERANDFNRTRIQPSPKRIHEMEETLEWMYWLKDSRNRKVVWHVACNISRKGRASYRKVAHADGRSHETMRAIWKDACEWFALCLMRAK